MKIKSSVVFLDSNPRELSIALANGGDVESTDAYKRSLLTNAVIEKNIHAIITLLKSGALVNVEDKFGMSPLHYAACYQLLDIAKLLVEYGANVRQMDKFGNTPLHKAVFYSNGGGGMIKFLISVGAEVDVENNHGVSPLALAREISNYNVEQFF